MQINQMLQTQMNKLILTIGKTHSGKTTFAEKLKDKINGVVIQTDPLA